MAGDPKLISTHWRGHIKNFTVELGSQVEFTIISFVSATKNLAFLLDYDYQVLVTNIVPSTKDGYAGYAIGHDGYYQSHDFLVKYCTRLDPVVGSRWRQCSDKSGESISEVVCVKHTGLLAMVTLKTSTLFVYNTVALQNWAKVDAP